MERIILYVILVGITYGCWLILNPLFSSILWAGIISFATWPMYVFMRKYIGRIISALVMTLFCALCMVLPIALLSSAVINDVPKVLNAISSTISSINWVSPPQWIIHIPIIGAKFQTTWEHSIEHLINLAENLRPYIYDITKVSLSLFLQTIGGFLQFAFALFISFFFWLNGDSLGELFIRIIHKVAGPKSSKLITMTSKTVLGTVYGILGTAILQGILTGCGLALFSIPEPILLGGIAAFLSIFPIGAPVVWIPAAIWLFFEHHYIMAILLFTYGITFISGVEHIIRPIFVSRGTHLPYLLSVLGILGGVLAFGGLGIFLGPVLLGLGYSLTIAFANEPKINT